MSCRLRLLILAATVAACLLLPTEGRAAVLAKRHSVPREHPRLLGSRARLQSLAKERPDAYQRTARVAREQKADDHAKMISMALVSAIEGDADLGRRAVEMALTYARGPTKKGHTPFGHDLARCALVYDLCHERWTDAERTALHDYVNRTVDANPGSETHVFHNGWYGYKWWGIGLACYATYYENPRAAAILAALEREYQERAAPALELAGAGGGWAEGHYVHYWLYEWLFFCEAARFCEGADYLALAPSFYRHRAVASMFETYPGVGVYGSRRPVPMGDGGGRTFGGDRDKQLSARRILVNRFRDDPDHQAVHAFNETTPRSSVGVYAYKDFLWRDATVPKGNLAAFRLSHVSLGAGYVYARSAWDDDATYFFFKCGDRFTAHQHLDVGHFLIYRHDELAGDGGHYDGFGTRHDVNYHLRTIAHSTVLVHDPAERWPGIRAGPVSGNDGGQRHDWPHHNGAVADAAAWHKGSRLYDIADLLAFEDAGPYVYVAGDCTRAYAAKKVERFTRRIVYLRPGTFVVFDRVVSRDATFRKTWLLQAMKAPTHRPPHWLVTNGKGRLFIQTVLPQGAKVRTASGDDLCRYGGEAYPPNRTTGPAPECRIEVSPPQPRAEDVFLHVLTTTDSGVESVPAATADVGDGRVTVTVGGARIVFPADAPGGRIELGGKTAAFPDRIVADYLSGP
ncbi:MAG TPA: heparinase II/III family protein [Phycisphaerae bacterium]|nr:heparinase II/III family protein [Phycisphaerae bacterium]